MFSIRYSITKVEQYKDTIQKPIILINFSIKNIIKKDGNQILVTQFLFLMLMRDVEEVFLERNSINNVEVDNVFKKKKV